MVVSPAERYEELRSLRSRAQTLEQLLPAMRRYVEGRRARYEHLVDLSWLDEATGTVADSDRLAALLTHLETDVSPRTREAVVAYARQVRAPRWDRPTPDRWRALVKQIRPELEKRVTAHAAETAQEERDLYRRERRLGEMRVEIGSLESTLHG